MNFQNILNLIEKTDPEVYERTSERRHVLKTLGRVTTLAAVPFALGALFNKAYGRTTSTIIDILNYALTLELLESNFYQMGNASTVIPSSDQPAFATIGMHEMEHVAFLQNTITSLGGTPVSGLSFDFTAKGTFPNPFAAGNYAIFLAISQTLED